MRKALGVLCFLAYLSSCKNNAANDSADGTYFPVVSFLKGQVLDIDTSLYRIVKIETINGVAQTSYIKREDFRKVAKEFLTLPDITSKRLKKHYEETKMFDDALNSVVLTYTTSEADLTVRREDVVLNPTNASGNSEVTTIIVNTLQNLENTTIEKNMVWYVNKRFTIVTKTQTATQPEQIKKVEVIWNDFNDQ